MNCKLVLSQRSQFFHSRRFFSSHAKLRSTIQRYAHLQIEQQRTALNKLSALVTGPVQKQKRTYTKKLHRAE